MKKLLFFVLVGMSQAQTPARVTIYTPGGWMRGSLHHGATLGVGEQETLSQGTLFEGERKLASMFPGRFITFELAPGEHVISTAPPDKNVRSDAAITAKAGEQYFLRLTATSKGAWIVQLIRPHLEVVACDAARKEADGTKPLSVRHIEKEARSHVVDATYFPRCQ